MLQHMRDPSGAAREEKGAGRWAEGEPHEGLVGVAEAGGCHPMGKRHRRATLAVWSERLSQDR